MSSLKTQCPPQTYSRLFRPWDMSQRSAAANASPAPVAPNASAVARKKLSASNCLALPQNLSIKRNGMPPTAAPNTIKMEFVKFETNAMDAEQSETEDEVVEVDDDYLLHTSRTSECASSQSNCSQLSDEHELFSHEQRACSSENIYKASSISAAAARSQTQSPCENHSFASRSTADRQALMAQYFHTREAFELQQQQRLHFLAQSGVPTTPAAAAATAPPPPPPTTTTLSSDFFYATNAAAAISSNCDVATSLPTTTLLPTSSNAAAVAAAANAASFAGMEAYTFGLMEQEYARILAEEAHLKAINARKQRPKKFKCPHCNVAFSNNGQLKGHIRIHTGERPFKCDVESCGKTFTRNEELTRHKRIHTGLRPYPCAACGKKFGRRDHLKKHMKTHMPQERQLGPAIFVPMYPYLYGY